MSTFSKLGKNLSSEQLLFLARVSEASDRFEDMSYFTSMLAKNRCKAAQELSIEERNLLSVAYKHVVSSLRLSIRTLNSEIEENETVKETALSYKQFVEQKLESKCLEILNLLQNNLLIQYADKKDENEVFYLKMCGDYYRYLAEYELSKNVNNSEYALKADQMYSKALKVAKSALSETHPTKLGLALNYSVCCYDILKKPEKACSLAQEAFDGAINKLDTLSDASYKDSTLIMQLLRDNLTLWTESNQTEED